jgi:hypothetical protein
LASVEGVDFSFFCERKILDERESKVYCEGGVRYEMRFWGDLGAGEIFLIY